jgi:hypothetical protein
VPISESGYWESLVADFLPPDASQYPGGALQLAAPPPPPSNPAYDPFCFVAAGEVQPGTVTVISRDWVLSGTHAGYAGRPQESTGGVQEFYALAWQDEVPLLAACPLLQDPAPSPMPACDAACRAACESLVLARKARRTDYPAEPPCAPNTFCHRPQYQELTDPLQAGPALKFRLALTNIQGGSKRAMFLSFSTLSGILQMSRRPSLLSQGTSAIAFDKSRYPGKEGLGTVFYVTYLGDLLFEMPPGETVTGVATIR